MIVRHAHDGRDTVRPLTPLESVALIGWHTSLFKDVVGADAACLYSMAGNAFSGFGFVPMLAISLTGAGIVAGLPGDIRARLAVGEAHPPAPPLTEEGSDVESASSDASILVSQAPFISRRGARPLFARWQGTTVKRGVAHNATAVHNGMVGICWSAFSSTGFPTRIDFCLLDAHQWTC